MGGKLRHRTVSVGVIFDKTLGFLLFRNDRWGKYAFCMKRANPNDDLGELALIALEEDSPLKFPEASARPSETIGAFGPSGSTGEGTYYDYQVYELDPGLDRGGSAAGPSAKFFKYADLMAASDVTWSTQEIARAMVEFREVSIAIITRHLNSNRQFLLIYNPSYGYFFPSARRKTNDPPEEMAIRAVEWDTSFTGRLQATWCREVQDIHVSGRHGAFQPEYRFHICLVSVPDVDLTQPGNPFAASADALERAKKAAGQPLGSRGYWDWFTEDKVKTFGEISPTMNALLPTIMQCVESG